MSEFRDSGGGSSNRRNGYAKHPVLTLSTANITQLDPHDPNTIHSLWAAFAKCSDLIDNGKRLENMSWRLWNREVLSIREEPDNAPIQKPAKTKKSKAAPSSASSLSDTAHSGDSNQIPPRYRSTTSLFSNNRAASPRPRLRRNSSSGSISGVKPRRKSSLKDTITPLTTTASYNKHTASETSSAASLNNRGMSALTPLQPTSNSSPGKTKNRSSNLASSSKKGGRLSYAQIQHILSLFKPESEDDAYWKQLWETKRQEKAEKRFVEAAQSVTSKSIIDMPLGPPVSDNNNSETSKKAPAFYNFNPPVQQQQKRRSLFTRNSSKMFSQSTDNITDNGGTHIQNRNGSSKSNENANIPAHEKNTDDDKGNDNEGNGNESDDRKPRRNSTFTSIVRGFSPSQISVSFVNRSGLLAAAEKQTAERQSKAKAGAAQEASSTDSTLSLDKKLNKSSTDLFKATKARPNKIARENMFFIESSPSDSETYVGDEGESLSSTEENHIVRAVTRKGSNVSLANASTAKPSAKPSNVSISSTDKSNPPARQMSLFAKSKSSSMCSTKLQEKYESAKDESVISDASDEDEDENNGEDESAWDSVEEESDYAFDEKSLIPKEDETHKKPLAKSSLLSSLFLNKPELVQQQKEAEEAKKVAEKEKQTSPSIESGNDIVHNPHGNSTAQTQSINASKLPSESPDQQSLPSNLVHLANPNRAESYNVPITTSGSMVSVAEAMSPKTTRRNMLASELSESLRKNLLFERQRTNTLSYSSPRTSQKDKDSSSQGANGEKEKERVLRRSHTSTGVSNIGPSIFGSDDNQASWKEDMDDDNLDFNYHARGW